MAGSRKSRKSDSDEWVSASYDVRENDKSKLNYLEGAMFWFNRSSLAKASESLEFDGMSQMATMIARPLA